MIVLFVEDISVHHVNYCLFNELMQHTDRTDCLTVTLKMIGRCDVRHHLSSQRRTAENAPRDELTVYSGTISNVCN